MKSTPRFLLAAGLLALAPFAAHAKIERVIEKTFTVQPGGTLHVDTQGGEVRVSPSSDNLVKITARERIRAGSESEADDILKNLELKIEQSGNEVSALAKYDHESIGFHFGSWPPVSVDFIVSVPASFSADVHTSGGGVSLEESRGPAVLHTSGGSITVGRVMGAAELSTSGGGIKIDSVEGAVQAHTSGGSVRAGIAGPLKEDCVLSTSGGGVKVNVDKAAAFRLDASTSGGGVDADGITITMESSNRGRSRLAGSVNGGGPLLKLRSSGGDIVVRAN